jgi:hypothetical protein
MNRVITHGHLLSHGQQNPCCGQSLRFGHRQPRRHMCKSTASSTRTQVAQQGVAHASQVSSAINVSATSKPPQRVSCMLKGLGV